MNHLIEQWRDESGFRTELIRAAILRCADQLKTALNTEPVAWMCVRDVGILDDNLVIWGKESPNLEGWKPLYTHPTPQPQCSACNDRGEIGGWDGSGYDTKACPHCNAPQPQVVSDEMVERACKRLCFLVDDAEFPTAYGSEEQAQIRSDLRAALTAALAAPKDGWAIVREQRLLDLTAKLSEHPDDWDGPCWCATCRSYAAEDAAAPRGEGGA